MRIALHATPWTAHEAVCTALGISRQALWLRTQRHGFPSARYLEGRGTRRFFNTQAVAAWCVANGYTVDWL